MTRNVLISPSIILGPITRPIDVSFYFINSNQSFEIFGYDDLSLDNQKLSINLYLTLQLTCVDYQ